MSAQGFLGLQSTHNPHRWVLPITPKVCTPGNFLYGGAALAAGLTAMEQTTGRQTVWATAQYLSFARPPSIVDIDVAVPVKGNSVTQARAMLHVNDQEVITVNAALGARRDENAGVWAEFPKDAPKPEDCQALPQHHDGVPESVHDHMDIRIARGLMGFWGIGEATTDGRSLMWFRIPDVKVCAASLAIMADFMPSGIGNVLNLRAGGNSLDNTIRVIRLVETEWVLGEVHVHGIGNGFGHGRIHLWAQDGTLLATASQSVIVRVRDELPPV